MEPAADEGPLEEAQLEDRIVQLKRVLEEDVSLTPEEREAEIKKARIALMRRLRSPATPYNSVEDFSKQAAQAKKKQQAPTLDAEALNSKLQDLGN